MKHPALEYLRKIRNQYSWTQWQFADNLEISRSYYSLIEEGRRRLTPSIKKKICEYMLTPNQIKEWETLLGKPERNQEKYQKFITMMTEWFDKLPEVGQDMALIKIKVFMEDRKRK